jgi:hypothetical protein
MVDCGGIDDCGGVCLVKSFGGNVKGLAVKMKYDFSTREEQECDLAPTFH